MTNAETYGPLAQINQLVNEYYALEKLDPSKLPLVQRQIWDLVEKANLRADLNLGRFFSRDHGDHKHDWDEQVTAEGVPVSLAEMSGNEVAHFIQDLDGYLCELGLAQIRDGLHILAQMPPMADMLRSLTRLPNAGVPGLQDALAGRFGLRINDLLERPGARLETTVELAGRACYTHADILRELDRLSFDLFAALEEQGFQPADEPMQAPSWAVRRPSFPRCSTMPAASSCPGLKPLTRKWSTSWTLSRVDMCPPAPRERPPAEWLTFFPAAEISMPSIRGPCHPRPPGRWDSNWRTRLWNGS
jgi:hypothetical protein